MTDHNLKSEADTLIRYVKENKLAEIRTRLKDLSFPEHAINAHGTHGQTPMWRAARDGRLEIAELFIRCGGNLHITDKQSRSTPLHVAAEYDHPELVTLLLKHNGGLEARRVPYQETPLWLACNAGSVKSARILIDAGADIFASNSYDIDCYHAAKTHTYLPILAMLRDSGYQVEEPVFEVKKEEKPGPGYLVSHPIFGQGTILSTTGYDDNLKYQIDFGEEGEKLLLARFVTVEGKPTSAEN